MGMEENVSRLIQNLDNKEIETLLTLYYNKEGMPKSIVEKKALHDLVDKNLISTKIQQDKNIINLTEEGLNLCGSIMYTRINQNKELLKTDSSFLPERAIACFVKRIIWKESTEKETGFIDPVTKPYELDESLWFERVLLKDKRIADSLEKFYNVLEKHGFVKNIDGQRWSSPEVEAFLKEEYKNIMDLTWAEEDSLKYYFFFYVYAQDQKNLIDFTGEGEEYKSMFFGDHTTPPDYWYSSNRSEPNTLLANLGISEQRAIGFLDEMENKEIVNERMYPLSSFSFFSDEEKMFVIQDIDGYMQFIKNRFLTPVVDSILSG